MLFIYLSYFEKQYILEVKVGKEQAGNSKLRIL